MSPENAHILAYRILYGGFYSKRYTLVHVHGFCLFNLFPIGSNERMGETYACNMACYEWIKAQSSVLFSCSCGGL